VGPARRIDLHLRVGQAVEELADPDDHVETLAHHFTEAAPVGGGAKALLYSMAAAERAMSQTAFEQGAEQIRRALDATRADSSIPPSLMAEAYECLALTSMPTPTGDFRGHRAACLEAADWARRAGSAEGLAVAAIEALSWAEPDIHEPEIEALGAEALALRDTLPEDLGALLLAMSVLYRSTGEHYGEPIERASAEALAVARASGSPDATRAASNARYWSIFPTPKAAERLALAEEQLFLPEEPTVRPRATRMHRTARIPMALTLRALAHLEMGERDAFDADVRAIGQISDGTGFARARSALWGGLVLLMDGRFDEAERLASGMLEERLQRNYETSYVGLLFGVKYEQGRLDEIVPLLAGEIERDRMPGAMHATAAVAYEQAGDTETARSLLTDLARDDFAGLPLNIAWAAAFTSSAEVTALLGEPGWARVLYRRLLPYAGLHAVIAWGVACRGAYDRYLGMLAATFGDTDRAQRHYEAALRLEEQLRTPPAIARTKYWYGRLLVDRATDPDRQQAATLLRSARSTATSLGMDRLVRDIDLMAPAGPPRGPRPPDRP
jgi:tetratricopeptide (TPR) repeat protein